MTETHFGDEEMNFFDNEGIHYPVGLGEQGQVVYNTQPLPNNVDELSSVIANLNLNNI